MTALQFFFKNLGSHRRVLLICLFIALLDSLVVFAIPALLAEFSRYPPTLESFYRLAPLLLGCFIASLVCQWVLRGKGEALAKEFGGDLRMKCFRLVEAMPMNVLGRYHSGYLLALSSKLSDSGAGILYTVVWLAAHFTGTIFLFFLFTARESLLVAFLNLAVLALFLLVSLQLSRKMVVHADLTNRAAASLTERFVDFMGNINSVKRLGTGTLLNLGLSQKWTVALTHN